MLQTPGKWLSLNVSSLHHQDSFWFSLWVLVQWHYLTFLILLRLTERERNEGSENVSKAGKGKRWNQEKCVCVCLCVIKVCEGWGPCSWGKIDWRHVNYRRQATCVTFLSSVCSHIPSFSQVTDFTPLIFFSIKLSEIHSASLCLALCSTVAEV